jgi:hypothetical protein
MCFRPSLFTTNTVQCQDRLPEHMLLTKRNDYVIHCDLVVFGENTSVVGRTFLFTVTVNSVTPLFELVGVREHIVELEAQRVVVASR